MLCLNEKGVMGFTSFIIGKKIIIEMILRTPLMRKVNKIGVKPKGTLERDAMYPPSIAPANNPIPVRILK